MTTNDLPTPAAWIDKNGGIWPPIEGRTIEGLTTDWPGSAPFVPVYRADDLPALVLPEVADEDAAAAGGAYFYAHDDTWMTVAHAVRDSLASRMRPPTLADVLPNFPDLGEGEWVQCFADCPPNHRSSIRTVFEAYWWWCFVPVDPDADAKAALTAAAGLDDDVTTNPAEILDTLRAAGWDLVRQEGGR